VALILVVGVIAFVRRRRGQHDFRRSAGSSFTGVALEPLHGPQMAVTPFNTNTTLTVSTTQEAGSPVYTTSDELFSTSEPTIPPSQNTASIPVGLSSKELAQLRSAPMPSAPMPSAPMPSAPMPSPPTHPHSTSSVSPQSTSPPTISITDGRLSTATPTSDTRRLVSEVESLRREMQQLLAHAERFEAPPSYGDGEDV
jgi:hypothetical protein